MQCLGLTDRWVAQVILEVLSNHLSSPKAAAIGCILMAQFASHAVGKQTAIECDALQLPISALQLHPSHAETQHDALGGTALRCAVC